MVTVPWYQPLMEIRLALFPKGCGGVEDVCHSQHPSDFHSTRQSFREEVILPVVTFRLPGFFSTSLTPKVHGHVHDQGVS